MNNVKEISRVEFPEYKGIYANMMPFIMGDNSTIPEEYRSYIPVINSISIPDNELGKIGFISIHESIVDELSSQRRPGIHTEKHPKNSWGGGGGAWGGGGREAGGGLFMASNVANSCRAWDTYISIPGKMGDCEHLRNELGIGIVMKPNVMYWMNDSCPHESMTLSENTKRQWFRLVTSKVDVWYRQHSTENKLGIKPICRIIEGSKFDTN